MATFSNNRSSDRRSVTWRVKILVPLGQVVEAKTTDASANGLGMLCAKPLLFNGIVQLALQVPVHRAVAQFQVVTGKARVVSQILRGNEYQVGVEWTQIIPEMLQIVMQHLERIAAPQRSGG